MLKEGKISKPNLSLPCRVYISKETNFKLCPEQWFGKKGYQWCLTVWDAHIKFFITVKFVFLAYRNSVEHMAIYLLERILCVHSVPVSCDIGGIRNSWMIAQTSYEWIGNVFVLFQSKTDVKLTVIIFVYEHNKHLTRETSRFFKCLQIISIDLYPNATIFFNLAP